MTSSAYCHTRHGNKRLGQGCSVRDSVRDKTKTGSRLLDLRLGRSDLKAAGLFNVADSLQSLECMNLLGINFAGHDPERLEFLIDLESFFFHPIDHLWQLG